MFHLVDNSEAVFLEGGHDRDGEIKNVSFEGGQSSPFFLLYSFANFESDLIREDDIDALLSVFRGC